MKFCSKCGQKVSDDALRCSACRQSTGVLWLTVFNTAGSLLLAVMVYTVAARFVPAMVTFIASLGMMISPFWRFQSEAAHLIVTFGTALVVPGGFLILGAAAVSRNFPRFSRVLAGLIFVGLVSMASLNLANVVSLYSLAEKMMQASDARADYNTERIAVDAVRRTIAAEYSYRDMHPREGFACDFSPLEPLGGPTKGKWASPSQRKGVLDIGPYALSLTQCVGNPVNKYQLTAVPNDLGSSVHVSAFCSDGSSIIYSSADGKASSCLKARSALP